MTTSTEENIRESSYFSEQRKMERFVGNGREQRIIDFFNVGRFPAEGRSCTTCGASIDWNWSKLENIELHMDWHEKYASR